MVKTLNDEVIKEQIIQTLEGTDFQLISFERNHEVFGNMVANIKSQKEKYTFSTDRGDIWCNDRQSILAGYHIAGQDDTPTYLIKAIRDTIKPNPNIIITWAEPTVGALRIRLGYEERIMDSVSGQVGFAVDNPGKYCIEVAEEPVRWDDKITNVGYSLIHHIFYGIVCAVNAWGVRGKWEKDVRAYVVKGRFEVELVDIIETVITYKPSEYREEQKDWSYPSLVVTPAIMTEIQFDPNPLDFSNKLNDYIIGLRIIAAPGIIFFGFIALNAILAGAGAVAITFGALTAGVLAAIIGVTRSQREKCRRLYKKFITKKAVTTEDSISE